MDWHTNQLDTVTWSERIIDMSFLLQPSPCCSVQSLRTWTVNAYRSNEMQYGLSVSDNALVSL